MTDEVTTCVALLHDVVEDTDMTFEKILEFGFTVEIVDALKLLTHDDSVPYMDYVKEIAKNPIAKAVKLAHEINPENKVGCMLSAAGVYPYTCNPDDVLEAQEQMNRSNWFCGDVCVKGKYPHFMNRFFPYMLHI